MVNRYVPQIHGGKSPYAVFIAASFVAIVLVSKVVTPHSDLFVYTHALAPSAKSTVMAYVQYISQIPVMTTPRLDVLYDTVM
jgi:hypothetical protein